MCILFIYNAFNDQDSDYNIIIATNRDEFYDRATKNMSQWEECPHVYGGIDLEAQCQGTWLAYSLLQNKIGFLLNLPGTKKANSKSRGQIVADYVKNNLTTERYTKYIEDYVQDCKEFIFVSVEFRDSEPVIQSYSNATSKLEMYNEICMGFSNSLPYEPMKKVEAGKNNLRQACEKYKKIDNKTILIEKLVELLKSEEKHLPDPELQRRRPNDYQWYSSIYVCIPPGRYGTRTHTLMLVTKTGHVDLIEIALQSPIDVSEPEWKRSEFQFDIKL